MSKRSTGNRFVRLQIKTVNLLKEWFELIKDVLANSGKDEK